MRRRSFIRNALGLAAAAAITPGAMRPVGRYCLVREYDTMNSIVRRAYPGLSARERLEQMKVVSAANSEVAFVPLALLWLPDRLHTAI